MASRIVLPMINPGIMYIALTLDILAPKNSGVVGSGNNELSKHYEDTFSIVFIHLIANNDA